MLRHANIDSLNFYLTDLQVDAFHKQVQSYTRLSYMVVNTFDGSFPQEFLINLLRVNNIKFELVLGRLLLPPQSIDAYFDLLSGRSVGNSYFFFDQVPTQGQLSRMPDGYLFVDEVSLDNREELAKLAEELKDVGANGYICDDYRSLVVWRGKLDIEEEINSEKRTTFP